MEIAGVESLSKQELKRNKIYQGDVLEVLKTLPDESVQCVVTSPPYFQCRDYGVEGQVGLEKSPEEYVAKMVEIFNEVRRILRKDGVMWLNLGNSYATNGIYIETYKEKHPEHKDLHVQNSQRYPDKQKGFRGGEYKIKPKDLIGIPWLVAIALQREGWWLRSDCIWMKRNCMPSSVTDRPTTNHEYIFLLTKSQNYFYDHVAIQEPVKYLGRAYSKNNLDERKDAEKDQYAVGGKAQDVYYKKLRDSIEAGEEVGKNKRTVWDVTTKGYSGAHFAVFPPDLIEPPILAGTSEKGACPKCGTPWKRIRKDVEGNVIDESPIELDDYTPDAMLKQDMAGNPTYVGFNKRWKEGQLKPAKYDWVPGCSCGETTTVPCIVMDIFGGSGTTAEVALKTGRDFVLIEINPEYIEIAEKRLRPYRNKRLDEFV